MSPVVRGSITFSVVQVPDGNFILYLYQMDQLSEVVADSSIGTAFRIEDMSMVPDRSEDVSDFFYGVYRVKSTIENAVCLSLVAYKASWVAYKASWVACKES